MAEETKDEGVPIEESVQDATESSLQATTAQREKASEKKRRFIVGILAIVAFALVAAFSTFTVLGVRKLQQNPDFTWKSRNMIAIYITVIVSILIVLAIVVQVRSKRKRGSKKRLAYWICLLLLALIGFWSWTTLDAMLSKPGVTIRDAEPIALCFASGIVSFVIVVFVVLLNRAKTRWEMEERLYNEKKEDQLVIFNWTKKILHIPTIIASFLAALIVWVSVGEGENPSELMVPKIVGATWFCVWFVCHTIEDYDFNLTTVIALLSGILLIIVLVHFGSAWDEIGNILRKISIYASPALYIGFGVAYLASIALSYVKGVFYYVAIEPNQITVQHRIGEDAETFQKMHYDVRVETAVDVFEWFFYDTGTIVITFHGGKRPPIECYVGRIRKKAPRLGNILGVTAVEPDRL